MIRLVTNDDAMALAANMAADDEREVGALGLTAGEALSACIRNSNTVWSWSVNDQPLAIFGIVNPTCLTDANPWFLTAKDLPRHGIAFYKDFRRVIDYMRKKYGPLSSWVDGRHCRSLKLLGRMGFDVIDSQQFGPEGVAFKLVRLG